MVLLHSGAGLHGHEFSSSSKDAPSSSTSGTLTPRLPLQRSPYSVPGALRPTSYQDCTKAPFYIRPARRLSPSRRRTINERVSFRDIDIEDTMSDDEQASIHSDDESSVAGSTATGRGRPRKPKLAITTYQLAGPAPTMTQKQRLVHLRPKLLLQLQRTSNCKRPTPALDVMSSATFAPRLAKKFPGLFKLTSELGINDVIVVKSEDYETPHDDEDTGGKAEVCDDGMANREIVAVICQAPKGGNHTGEICIDDGSRWYLQAGKKGALEISKTDSVTGERVLGRWVRRGPSPRNSYQTPTRGSQAIDPAALEQRYTFSFIDPTRRRHPVLATLSQNVLKVNDTYYASSPTSSSETGEYNISSARTSMDSLESEVPSLSTPSRHLMTLTDKERLIIQTSAVWVASRLGWTPWFKYEIHATPASSRAAQPLTPGSASTDNAGSRRRHTMTPTGSGKQHKRARSGTVVSEKGSVGSRRSLMGRLPISSSTFLSHCSDSGAESDTKGKGKAPQRSVSTGAAFMQRRAERLSNSRPGSLKEGGDSPNSASRSSTRPPSPTPKSGTNKTNIAIHTSPNGGLLADRLLSHVTEESARTSKPDSDNTTSSKQKRKDFRRTWSAGDEIRRNLDRASDVIESWKHPTQAQVDGSLPQLGVSGVTSTSKKTKTKTKDDGKNDKKSFMGSLRRMFSRKDKKK